mmetsp:Transcript_16640/g.42667  ORF Transcript_16640/g.42667 Transcript_16640/m.42667 type:complete len:339 (+) Transcript_16640:1074-2090(+)
MAFLATRACCPASPRPQRAVGGGGHRRRGAPTHRCDGTPVAGCIQGNERSIGCLTCHLCQHTVQNLRHLLHAGPVRGAQQPARLQQARKRRRGVGPQQGAQPFRRHSSSQLRLPIPHLQNRMAGGVVLGAVSEGKRARGEFIHGDSPGVGVGCSRRRLLEQHLWRHVLQRADEPLLVEAAGGLPSALQQAHPVGPLRLQVLDVLADAEVCDDRLTRVAHQQRVGGLDVAVHDAFGVQMADARGHLRRRSGHLGPVRAPALLVDGRLQVTARERHHDEVVRRGGLSGQHAHHVGVLHQPHHARLLLETHQVRTCAYLVLLHSHALPRPFRAIHDALRAL